MRSSSVTSGGAELAVGQWGEPSAPPIVALHAGVCDRRSWERCASTWVEAGHRVVAYDRRGFGQTTAPNDEPADDLADLVLVTAATAAQPALVVGNSMGGGLALDLALAHSDHVRALVLIGTFVSGYDWDRWVTTTEEGQLEQRIAAAGERGDIDEVNQLEVHYWLDGPRQQAGRVHGAARDLMLDMNGIALRAGDRAEPVPRPDIWPRLGEITVPVLVLVGEHDEVGSQRMSQDLAEALPDGRFVELAGTAHCPMLDQPDLLAATVIDFARSVIV